MAGWERAFETARLAKIPHLLYKEQWEKKQLQVKSKVLRYKISMLDYNIHVLYYFGRRICYKLIKQADFFGG